MYLQSSLLDDLVEYLRHLHLQTVYCQSGEPSLLIVPARGEYNISLTTMQITSAYSGGYTT